MALGIDTRTEMSQVGVRSTALVEASLLPHVHSATLSAISRYGCDVQFPQHNYCACLAFVLYVSGRSHWLFGKK